MATDMIRVTLTAPYLPDTLRPEGRELSMRYGTSDAILPDAMNSEDYVIDMRTRQPKIIPGSPILYVLKYEDENMRSTIMPEAAAKHYFGNWDIADPAPPQTDTEKTKPYEKMRLTTLWGDYKKRPRDRNVGNDWRSLDKIAPPVVPHVVLEKIGNNLQPVAGFAWDPWTEYAWDMDCVENVWDQFGRRRDMDLAPQTQAAQTVQGFSEAQMVEMMAKMREQMKAELVEELTPKKNPVGRPPKYKALEVPHGSN